MTRAADVEANKGLVRRLFADVFNAGDLDAADALVREDYLQHSPTVAPGRAGLKAFVADLRRAFPDLRVEVDDLIAEGDRVVARVVGCGTHRGEYLGIAPTGRPFCAAAIDVFRIEGGLLAEHWDVMDLYGLLLQLGAVAPIGGPTTP